MRIVLCEDDSQQREYYYQLLNRLLEKSKIKNEIVLFESGKQLLFELEDMKHFDLIFLDIHMEGIDGMAVAEKLRELSYTTEIIFLTKDQERVWEAFDVDAMQYMVKSRVSEADFEGMLEKAFKKVREKKEEYILLSCAGEIRRVKIQEIQYFEVVRNIIKVHYSNHQSFEFYSTLGKIENLLLGKNFVRTHRSFLVSLEQIEIIRTTELILLNGEQIPISRKNLMRVKDEFERFYQQQ